MVLKLLFQLASREERALSDCCKLKSGDAILSGSDGILYENASCKSASFAAITPNVCLSSCRTVIIFFQGFFLFVTCFNIWLLYRLEYWFLSFNPSHKKRTLFLVTMLQLIFPSQNLNIFHYLALKLGINFEAGKTDFLTSTYGNCWTILKRFYIIFL